MFVDTFNIDIKFVKLSIKPIASMFGIFVFVACSHTAVYLCLVAVVDKISV